MATTIDLVVVSPGGRGNVYQQLSDNLAAIEPPLWCRLIAGYVRDRGHGVAIIDTEAENLSPAEVAERIARLSPRLVAMVVFGHQPSASTQNMVGAAESCRAINVACPGLPVIAVGGHVSALPERTILDEPFDFVCKGEGPVTIVALLDALRPGRAEDEPPAFASIPGLVWQDADGVMVNCPAELIKDLDADLHGNVWDLLPMDKYRGHNWQCFDDLDTRMPYASIYTTLGCPYRCSFCCINAPFGVNRYRMRKPAAVVAEVDLLYRTYGVRTFKIIDEMFVLNDRHVVEICDGLIDLGYSDELNFWAYARVDTVKPAMLAKLRKAGIRWLALGIESGSKHVRDGASKAFRHEDIVAIVRQIQQAGIAVIGNYIFGLPDDTLETMRETLDLAKDLNCEFANLYSAMAYPGSRLYDLALEKGWRLPESWTGYSQHSYECTPLPTETLSAADVLRFRDQAFTEYFANTRYLDMVTQRFGWDTRRHVEDMARHQLRRRLLEA